MSDMRSSREIRNTFLTFFEERGHEVVPSDSLVPADDPTLLFTNAGMNQFKDVFLGTGDRPYRRAVNTQKCLRVSGKHNDLEEVGLDTYHHTFFEMLGNWSFGDYFKKEAIEWAWELFVDVYGLDPQRLYATVHAGDERLGLEPDDEAADLWRRNTGIDPNHVLPGSSEDNFWMMGDTGPCGPCSEIHIDLRSDEERGKVPGSELVNADHPQVMELWNLVFIQYNALPDGTLDPLKARHVDTGMGFERLVAVLQGKTSNYDTDLFEPLLNTVASLSPRPEIVSYHAIEVDDRQERERCRVAMRVVADHVRTIAFAIADGVSPGNVGRSYVIRRILRRAVRFGYQTLGIREPFIYRLVDPLQEKMGDTFPELRRQREYIEKVIRSEEENFLETLGTGIGFFEQVTPYVHRLAGEDGAAAESVVEDLLADRQTMALLDNAYDAPGREGVVKQFAATASTGRVPGEVAFLLHDTYGFPIDLTQLMAREEDLGVDMDRYDVLMDEQKDRARAATSFKIDQSRVDEWTSVTPGEDFVFVGYDELEVDQASVRAMRSVRVDGDDVRYEVVLDRTPFYAESGGQVGDVGVLEVGGERIEVQDTQKLQDRIVHVVDRLPEAPDAPVRAVVDAARRTRIQKHHTATHLVHAALRELLGEHVQQKGSLVAPDRLRFDFSHYDRVSDEELQQIEARVNEVIQRNVPRHEARDVPIEEARERGAMALFGEKYGDRVRVITFDPGFSVELCGGTHVEATGEIGVLRFVSEGSVASGVRRVEAVAGEEALEHIEREIEELNRVRGQFKGLQRSVSEEVHEIIEENRRLQQTVADLRREQLAGRLDGFIEAARQVDGVRLVTGRLEPASMDALHELGQTLRDRLGDGSVAILGTVDPEGEKVYMVAGVADDVVASKGLKAGDLVGRLARIVGGGGGGRPTLATAGGRQPEKLDEALDNADDVVRELMRA
ncbi:MAG: alanine--tRNA ligase [Rhodothermales bacterium]